MKEDAKTAPEVTSFISVTYLKCPEEEMAVHKGDLLPKNVKDE